MDEPARPAAAAAVDEHELAAGCLRGDPAAIAIFERDYLSVVPAALAGMRLPAATVEDVRSATRDKLLPRLAEYAGGGRLRGLVQVTATRIAIDLVRRDRKLAPMPASFDATVAGPGDAELSLIKAQYREAFVAALRAAVTELAPRDRNLVRLHFLGGVTLERLAAMYGVSRATVVRWLAAARTAILAATRARVASTLGAPDDELDEMFALVASRAELSLDRLLHASVTNPGT